MNDLELRSDELYWIMLGMHEDGTIEMLVYGDSNATPRIYNCHTFDGRLYGQSKLCNTIADAVGHLRSGVPSICLPLSVMIEEMGETLVTEWFSDDDQVMQYVNMWKYKSQE